MASFEYKRDLSNLPAKIRCDVGKEWKEPVHFSKTKLHKFANAMRMGERATAANSGIACRIHSGEPETVMQCHGPCGKSYGLDNFSRNTRIRGVFWCNDCTDYQLTNEPGFMPYPAPYAPLVNENQAGAQDAVSRANTVRDDDTLSIAPSVTSFAPSNANAPVSTAASTDYGGPTGSSAIHTIEGSVISDDTAGAQNPRNDAKGMKQYYAWAPDGTKHVVTKAPTVISEASTVTPAPVVKSNGWTKVPMRKNPADAPDYFKFGRCTPKEHEDYHSDDGFSDDEM